jgi:LmbE family N-acetylglucosaminyl deacetylase
MIDLLVFGPHPDDLEIGMGGTIARHTSAGMRVGLCDLTAGEMGSNGTPDERLAEAEAARIVLGAVWRMNLRWRIGDGKDSGHLDEAVSFVGVIAESRRDPYWFDRHPDRRRRASVN